MPRITPLQESEWPDELRAALGARPPAVGARLGDNNIFATFARHQELFRAWLPFGGFLLGRGVLGARERELLILRTACNCRSSYEWGQHVRIALRVGISRDEIDRVPLGPGASGWTEVDAGLLAAADELHNDAKISSATWATLAAAFDERGLLEIAMLVGHYHLVAYALNSLEVELDEGLEALPGP
jgi:alkylhydroperoxidase family enzyme